jgi:Periplasmic protein involved in polysaccharide export
MKAVKLISGIVLTLVFSQFVWAQNDPAKNAEPVEKIETEKIEPNSQTPENPPADEVKTEDAPVDDKRKESASEEEAAILPYYNNYLKDYRLGPEDVISVEVFGQCPDYCKTGVVVPPTARISYPLIREGIFVGGKTIEQVQDEITKKLDEYIIDPKVTVTLDKVGSARYSVLGKVGSPGIRLMTRRVSIYEAVVEAGGVLKEGDRKRVMIYRQTPNGLKQIAVNLQEIERGRAEMVYLVPGDQVFVPDTGFKLNMSTVFKVIERASLVRILFGSPF